MVSFPEMASSNGPRVLYSMKPYYNSDMKIELPECLYPMKNLHVTSTTVVVQNESNSYELLAKRQEAILKQLENLKEQVSKIRGEITGDLSVTELITTTAQPQTPDVTKDPGFIPEDIVVSANPSYPPLGVWVFSQLLKKSFVNIRISVHTHSSVRNLPLILEDLPASSTANRLSNHANVAIIWKDGVGVDAVTVISPLLHNHIVGEVNLLRYLCRTYAPNLYGNDPDTATEIDHWLDRYHFALVHGNNKEKQSFVRLLNSHFGRSSFLVGDSLSLADLGVFSGICLSKLDTALPLPTNVAKWWKHLSALFDFSNIMPLIQA